MNESITMLLCLIPLVLVAMVILFKAEGDLLDKTREEKTAQYKKEGLIK